jgi:serine/threonine protein kinase
MSVEAEFHRYRIVEHVAQGAFGAVFRAADRVPGKEVALRVVSGTTTSEEAVAAFETDMQRATELRHHALAQVYEVGRVASGEVWAATEFVVGEPLERVVAEQGALPLETALVVFSELARGLAELHGHGLAHGSLSARAILLPRSRSGAPRPKIVGLGRARLRPRAVKMLAPPEGPYSSPELVSSQQDGAASDVWALGVLLFHCVTGRTPFVARTTPSFLAEVRGLPRILGAIEDEVVRGLIEQCLARVPDERPAAEALVKQAELAGWIELSGAAAAPSPRA